MAGDDWALVTGGSRSIGGGICRRLTEDGCKVLILDREAPDHEEPIQRSSKST